MKIKKCWNWNWTLRERFYKYLFISNIKIIKKGQSNCEVCLKEWSGRMKAAVKEALKLSPCSDLYWIWRHLWSWITQFLYCGESGSQNDISHLCWEKLRSCHCLKTNSYKSYLKMANWILAKLVPMIFLQMELLWKKPLPTEENSILCSESHP